MFQIFQNFIAEWKTISCVENFRDIIMLVRRLFKSISVCFWKEMFDHKLIYSLSVKFCIKKNKSIDLHSNQPSQPIKDVHKLLVHFDLLSLQFWLAFLPLSPCRYGHKKLAKLLFSLIYIQFTILFFKTTYRHLLW